MVPELEPQKINPVIVRYQIKLTAATDRNGDCLFLYYNSIILISVSFVCSFPMLYFVGMVKIHDTWYKKLFTNPRIVEDLLTAFVKERFVQGLDFSSIKKLNTSFVSEEFKKRESDVIYEIKSHGKTNYIYLLIEFQSTVDHFMALRIARRKKLNRTTKS